MIDFLLYCLYLGSLIIHYVTHALLSFDKMNNTKIKRKKNQHILRAQTHLIGGQ